MQSSLTYTKNTIGNTLGLLLLILSTYMNEFNASGHNANMKAFNCNGNQNTLKQTIVLTPAGWTFRLYLISYLFLDYGKYYNYLK